MRDLLRDLGAWLSAVARKWIWLAGGAAAPEEPRARSLLPEVHVTLLREDLILPGLAELFAALGDELPSALAIVTGPSRSADIEQKLAIGVHGPGEVHVVIVRAT